MRASRAAILGALTVAVAACEALVGITDRGVAPGPDGSAAEGGSEPGVGVGSDSSVGPETSAGSGNDASVDSGVGADTNAGSDTGVSADADAGVRADASPGADAGPDAILDAPAPVDTGGDGSDGATPVDPDVPCAMQPLFLFCADFDSVTTVGQNWSWAFSSIDAGSVVLNSTFHVSPPNSAQIVAPPVAGSVTNVQLGKTIGTLYTDVRVAFDFRLDMASYANMPQIGIAQLLLTRQMTGSSVQINYNLGAGSSCQVTAYVAEAGAPVTLSPAVPALTTWVRAALAYDSSGALSVYVNGQLVGTKSIGAGAPGDVQVILGAAYVNSSGTTTPKVEMDNIVVTGH